MKRDGFSCVWTLMLICSVTVNVFLIRSLVLAKDRVLVPTPTREPRLVRVAESLGISVCTGRSDADIETDIRLALDDAPVAPKKIISRKELEEISTGLSQESYELLCKGCEFLENIAGERVWIIKRGGL